MEKENYFTNKVSTLISFFSFASIDSRRFTIEQQECQSKNAHSYPHSRFKSLQCNKWNAEDEMVQIISKPKQT